MKGKASSNGARLGEWWPGRRGGRPPESGARWPQRVIGVAARVVLWGVLCLVLARGVADMFADDRRATDRRSTVESQFPDSQAKTFAVGFARSYFDGGALDSFLADGLSDQTSIETRRRGPGTTVAWAMVAREATLGSSRALITVAVSLRGQTRYLTVPVARDSQGGLAVFDLPSLSPPPQRGNVAIDEATPLGDREAGAIGDLADRFLRTYLGGAGRRQLAYYLTPDARVAPMPSGLSVVAVDEPDALGERRDSRRVRVLVRVRDGETGVELSLRYRLEVVKRDRWLVSAVAGGAAR